MPSIVVQSGIKFDRDALLESFRADNIDGRVFFWPLSMLPMFNNKPTNFISYSLFSRALNLPSYHDISGDDIERVVKHIRSSLEI